MAMVDATLRKIAAEAATCERCPLYRNATHVVFGEGPTIASIMMIGEQPGDQEDLLGHPFVGPAGRILDKALAEVGLDRGKVFLTNVVKHFKHEMRGKRRIHKRPDRYEIERCRWWLDRELDLVQPDVVVALGVTAAQAIAGRPVVLSRERGRRLELAGARAAFVTIHPSAVLRMPDSASRGTAFAGLVEDLRKASDLASRKDRTTPEEAARG
jgi:uracil-DNA glycosylase family protein